MVRPLKSAGSNAKTAENAAVERRTTSYLSSLGTSSKGSTKRIVFGNTVCAPKATLVSSVSTSWKFVQVENTYACMVQSAFRMTRRKPGIYTPAIVTKPRIRWSNTLEGFASTRALISVRGQASRESERPILRSASITENARRRWTKMNSKYAVSISRWFYFVVRWCTHITIWLFLSRSSSGTLVALAPKDLRVLTVNS
jgi:hypothetical protein